MKPSITQDRAYTSWLKELKEKVRTVQIKAAVKVNAELLQFYWELGQAIVEKQKNAQWGDGFLKQLSMDLSSEFTGIKGFSLSNLKYIKQWYLFYSQEIVKSQQAVGQLTQIPWGHNIVIMSRCQDPEEAFFYIRKTIQNNWSRSVLTHHNATIGILICKSKNDTVVEYSLKDVRKPIGVSEYIITKHLPDEFESSLPSIEEIEAELNTNGVWNIEHDA